MPTTRPSHATQLQMTEPRIKDREFEGELLGSNENVKRNHILPSTGIYRSTFYFTFSYCAVPVHPHCRDGSNNATDDEVSSRSKAAISSRLPVRRGLDESEAAVYLSLSPSFFRKLVQSRIMPKPRLAGGRRIWDVEELDLAFKMLPREAGDGEVAFIDHDEPDSWADFE